MVWWVVGGSLDLSSAANAKVTPKREPRAKVAARLFTVTNGGLPNREELDFIVGAVDEDVICLQFVGSSLICRPIFGDAEKRHEAR